MVPSNAKPFLALHGFRTKADDWLEPARNREYNYFWPRTLPVRPIGRVHSRSDPRYLSRWHQVPLLTEVMVELPTVIPLTIAGAVLGEVAKGRDRDVRFVDSGNKIARVQ